MSLYKYVLNNLRGELESLTVKELKSILVINRIDYKGCCEKHELLERVKRLWTDLKSTPCNELTKTAFENHCMNWVHVNIYF